MFTVEQIEQAHDKVKSGADFPRYIQEIKQLGVIGFETWVYDSHTDYFGNESFKTSSDGKYTPIAISNSSNKGLFLTYLKSHQRGETDYFTFCNHCAETGIEKWVVSLETMSCTYYDIKGELVLVEIIPG